MQKRGSVTHEQLFQIMGLTLVMGVVAFMYMYSDFVVNDTTFERIILSRDIVFLSNTILASPSNINYNYSANINLSGYTFQFNNNELSIAEYDKGNFVYKFLFLNKFYKSKWGWGVDQTMNYLNHFNIYKQGQKYHFGPSIDSNSHYICPHSPSGEFNNFKILFDPILDGDNKGDLNTNLNKYSYEINFMVLDSIFQLLNQYGEVEPTLMYESSITGFELEDRKNKINEFQPNLTIILNTSFSPYHDNLAKIYYPSNYNYTLNSLKISCNIANNLKEKINLTTILIPVDATFESGKLSLLNLSNQSIIFIEFYGSLIHEQDIFQESSKISEAISNAII